MVHKKVTIENYDKHKTEKTMENLENSGERDGTKNGHEEELRRMFDAGGCVLVGDRWFGPNSSALERARYQLAFERRIERNRKRRERRHALEVLTRFERSLKEKPAWVQARLAGRTAVVETVGGVRRKVDYRKTFGPQWDPFAYPFPGGKLPLELVIDGGLAVWSFLKRSREMFDHAPDTFGTGRNNEGAGHRLCTARRKLCARSTLADCPTVTDIRVAWALSRESHAAMLRLGGLLHDLECFVANGLIVRRVGKLPKIEGRESGIRGWIGENCPELLGKYKTLMRYKALALRLRQAAGITDPIPTSAVLSTNETAESLLRCSVHGQARATDGRVDLFAWEKGKWHVDADGRFFQENENYGCLSRSLSLALAVAEGQSVVGDEKVQQNAVERFERLLRSARRTVLEILLATDRDMSSGFRKKRCVSMAVLTRQVEFVLEFRERWWRRGLVLCGDRATK